MSSQSVTAGAPMAFPKLPSQDVSVSADAVGEHRGADDAGVGRTSRACEPRRLPDDAPNILIVLIDDAGPALPTTFGGEVRTADAGPDRRRGHRLQPVPHHGDVLADAGVAADRPQPSPGRQRPDRGAGERLGRLLGRHSQEQRAGRRGAEGTTATRPARGASGTTRRPRRPPRPGRSTTGRPGSASSTSTASSPARRRSTSRTWCATRPACCRRRRRRRATT